MPNNIFFSQSGLATIARIQDYDEKRAVPLKAENGSVLENPNFKDIRNLDFSFTKDSPAIKLGIKPIDFSKVGRQ